MLCFTFVFLVFLICSWCISNQHCNLTPLAHLCIQLQLAILNISWLEEFFDIFSEMEFDNCLMICGEWFDHEWM